MRSDDKCSTTRCGDRLTGMSQPPPTEAVSEITLLLQRWNDGDREAFDRASDIVYPELQRIARAYLNRERPEHTLQPTALINEAFLRFSAMGSLRIEGRRQFYALAAQLMRGILVDHARTLNAQKRGGEMRRVTLDQAVHDPANFADEFLLIHEAIEELRGLNARKAELIELRYFGGLTLEECAEHFGISRAAAHREQRLAEAWLNQRIAG